MNFARSWRVSLQTVGKLVLEARCPQFKITLTRLAARAWRGGAIGVGSAEALNDYPGRPQRPLLVEAREMKHASGVPVEVEMLHSLAHIELGAIDNYWDTIVRFDPTEHALPREYFDDLVSVVDDEAKHFGWLVDALSRKGAAYGDIPAHKGLLEHAVNTKSDLLARLAVVPLVQEARGLDAGPRLIQKLASAGAQESANLVKSIVKDEVNHVQIGMRWFNHLCKSKSLEPTMHFHHLVLQYFPQGIPGPFAEDARLAAGMPLEFFRPISRDAVTPRSAPPKTKARP